MTLYLDKIILELAIRDINAKAYEMTAYVWSTEIA